MNMMKWLLGLVLSGLLTACGGGSGAGTSVYEGGGSSGGGTTTTTYAVTVSVERSGSATASITSTESVQAVATVKTSGGAPVEGVVVTFSQSGSLLSLAPSTGTALTGSDGRASIDISAVSTDTTGATTLTATATVGTATYSGNKSLSVTAGATSTATPQAINFVSVTPSDSAIVIKGAGGNGRTESATLTFQVVDASNAPIKGATVNFSVNPADSVTLNVPSAVSNASGYVTTTVQSGAVATSVVVTATAAANAAASAPSDTLIVSNGVAVAGSFEVVATKYNLDGRMTGASTAVTAYVLDANGNPVADGTAVSFTTDYGGIGSSTVGGCVTSNGKCSVNYWVQDPRGTGLATVIGTVRVGSSTLLSDDININMAGATGGSYIAVASDGSAVSTLAMSSCTQTFEFLLQDSDTGRSVAAGSTITAGGASSGFTATIKDGGTVLDSLSFDPTAFVMELKISDDTAVSGCKAGGSSTGTGFFTLRYTTPNSIVFAQRFAVTYPK